MKAAKVREIMREYVDSRLNGHGSKSPEEVLVESAKLGIKVRGGSGKHDSQVVARLRLYDMANAAHAAMSPEQLAAYLLFIVALNRGKEPAEAAKFVHRTEDRIYRWEVEIGEEWQAAHNAARRAGVGG